VLCVLAVASVTGRPAGSSPSGRLAAAPSATRSTTTQPTTTSTSTSTAAPVTIATSMPRAVAIAFAVAYARYLQGVLPADRLPACSPAARAMVVQSGSLPASLRVRQLRLTAVTGARGSWAARFAILDGRGRAEVSAELVLMPTRSGWEVGEVVAPDLDTLLATPTPAARATGPSAARRVAREFTDSYLAYTYGHAGVEPLRNLTTKLRATLGGHRPRVPESIRRLEPRVASLVLSRRGAEWVASANVTDGQNTYQVTSLVGRVRGRWLVVAVQPGG
jgi:hypothetical protein